jgi:hypothetical protein
MAIVCQCVSTTEKSCFSITASLESAIVLYTQNTRKGYTGRMASLGSPRKWQYDLIA